MTPFALEDFPFGRIVLALAGAVVLTTVVGSALNPPPLIAEEPKPVLVTNQPTVNAVQQGVWTVGLSSPITVASGTSIGIDPANNVVRVAAPQPVQRSWSFFIDYPDKTWTASFSVPAGKQLTIEYVSGHFQQQIGSALDQAGPPFLLTLTTATGGQTVSHVVPVIPRYIEDGIIGYFEVEQSLKVYADASTTVTLNFEHLFSPGYRYTGAMNVSGHYDDVP